MWSLSGGHFGIKKSALFSPRHLSLRSSLNSMHRLIVSRVFVSRCLITFFLQNIISHDLRLKNVLGGIIPLAILCVFKGRKNSLNNLMRYKLWTASMELISLHFFWYRMSLTAFLIALPEKIPSLLGLVVPI